MLSSKVSMTNWGMFCGSSPFGGFVPEQKQSGNLHFLSMQGSAGTSVWKVAADSTDGLVKGAASSSFFNHSARTSEIEDKIRRPARLVKPMVRGSSA